MLKRFTAGLMLTGLVVGVAAPARGAFIRALTGFESSEGFADTDEVIWQQPSFSGTTQGILCTLDASSSFCTGSALDGFGNPWDLSQVVPWAQYNGDRSYEIYWVWTNPLDTTAGVRATTFQADNLQRPSVHLGGKVRFRMAVTAFEYDAMNNTYGAQITDGSASLLLCLGIRETGKDVAQGNTDTGAGDIEFAYLPGSEVIPTPDPGGIVAFPPGGKRYVATTHDWPPLAGEPEWVPVEFNLANLAAVRGFANDGNGVNTAGDGVLNATINPSGDGVNRGVLEALFFSNDSNNINGEVFFIYIDDVELVSLVPDPVSPPTINQPVFSGNPVSVTVNTRTDASSAELFRNNSSLGSVAPVAGVATFNNLNLSPGNLLEATQTANTITSDRSLPVVVFAPGTLLADNFDSYADQAALNVFWANSISSPSPSNARLRLSTGSAASCENLLLENNPSGSNAARLYRGFGSANGTDADPLTFTYYFKQDIDLGNARTRIELARFTNGQWSVGARAEGTTGIGITNEVAGALQSEYGIMLRSTDPQVVNTNGTATTTDDVGTNGFFASSGLLWAPTGVTRTPGAWHKMQVVVKTSAIDYYIDDVLANPVEWPGGVPRPNTVPYQFVILGQGFSNNGPTFFYDNVSVTTSAASAPAGVLTPHECTSTDRRSIHRHGPGGSAGWKRTRPRRLHPHTKPPKRFPLEARGKAVYRAAGLVEPAAGGVPAWRRGASRPLRC